MHREQAYRFQIFDVAVSRARALSDTDGLEVQVLDADGVTQAILPVPVKPGDISP